MTIVLKPLPEICSAPLLSACFYASKFHADNRYSGYPDQILEAILALAIMIFLLPFDRVNGMVFRL
jgi:hypothetical protein